MITKHVSTGLLSPGVHWATDLGELYSKFATNPHRKRLLDGFLEGAYLLKFAGCCHLYLDGRFVTTKVCPGDFDACWDTDGVDLRLLDPVFMDFSNFRACQRARFCGEFFPTKATAKSPWTTFFEFFQTDKETGSPKGIVGLQLDLLP